MAAFMPGTSSSQGWKVMSTDIRLAVNFWQHPKTIKLMRKGGMEAVRSLQILWCFCAQERTSGILDGMDIDDIEIAADWHGDEGSFVKLLIAGNWLEYMADGTYALHGWDERQAYVSKAESRREQAKAAAEKRWSEKRSMPTAMPIHADGNADLCEQHCSEHNPAMPIHADGNAPLPLPVPVPKEDSTLTSFECLSSPGGDDSPASSPDGWEDERQGSPLPEGMPEDESMGAQETTAGNEPSRHEEQVHRGGPPPCPYEQIRDMYHTAFPEHPRVALLNAKRKGAVKARWGDAGKRLRELKRPDSAAERLAYFQRLFNKAAMSDFLTGKRAFKDGSVYRVDFDKLMSPGGFVGVIEGKYDNRPEA